MVPDVRWGGVVMNTSTGAPAQTVFVTGCSERIIIVVSIVCAGTIVLIVSCTAWVAIVRPRSRPDVEFGMDGKPVMALVPCGHRVLCESCHVSLQTRHCPIYMTPVESVLKILD